MAGLEWNLFSSIMGVIVGAGTTGLALGRFQGRVVTRVENLEKFVDEHDAADVTFRNHCHDEVLEEIRETRRTTTAQFEAINKRLDLAITFRTRQGGANDQ